MSYKGDSCMGGEPFIAFITEDGKETILSFSEYHKRWLERMAGEKEKSEGTEGI